MIQFNPFLSSIAAPAAAKTVQAVVHVAHEAGQSFLKTLSQLREQPALTASETNADAQAGTLTGQIQDLSRSFRSWLGEHGINSPFEMRFSLADNGDPIADVVGPESEKIVDLLYSNDQWLEKFSSLAKRTSFEETAALAGISNSVQYNSARFTISSD